jgi:hypothetical protein
VTYHRRIIVQHLEETERELVEAVEDLADRFTERPERIGPHPAYREFVRLVGPMPTRSDGYAPTCPNPLEVELQRLLGGEAGS